MAITDAGLGLVLMLAAGAAAAEGLALQVVVADFDVDGAFDVGRDIDRGKRGMPAFVGVEGADAHEPVNARLTLEIAVGVLALDVQRSAADAGLLVSQFVNQLRRVAVTLRPA